MLATEGPRGRSSTRILDLTLRFLGAGPIVILVILCVVIAALQPVFLSTVNLQNVLLQSSVVAAMIVLGLIVGIVNGTIYVVGRIPHPFIVTLATLSIVQSIGTVITHSQPLPGMPPLVNTLGRGFIGPIPIAAITVGIVAIIATVFLRRTQWGRWIYAVGGDREAARRMSIPVPLVLISAYTVCGSLAGAAGVLVAGNIGGASATIGQAAGGLLDAVAAVIIGGASIAGGRGTVWNCIVGALLIGVIRNGLALGGASPFLQGLLVGGTILVAVELDVVRSMIEGRIRTIQSNVGTL